MSWEKHWVNTGSKLVKNELLGVRIYNTGGV